MSGLVGEVARFAVDVREKGLDPTLRQDAARRVLDVIGNCLAARGEEIAGIVTAVADQWGGHEVAGAIGGASRYPAPSAALINGTLAHALDFDDTHLPSVLHPSSTVVPAALAVAEQADADGAAHAAVAAADLARHGLTGPPTVLEGRFGFFHAWCGDQARPEVVVQDLGTSWELPGIFFKPYPCNHFTHAGIDAALQLREDGLDPADIAEIELGAPTPVLRTIAQPPEVKTAPPTGYAGAFSGPYTVAAALLGGGGLGVWLDDFTDEAVADPRRLELAAKVRCVPDARCDEIFPHQFPAVLRVRTVGGTTLEKRVDANRGGPRRPLSDEELGAKFVLGARRVLPVEQAGRLEEAVLSLASAPSVREVVALTR